MGISDKLRSELDTLVQIAQKRDYRLNFVTVINIMQEHSYPLDEMHDIIQYFSHQDVEVIFDDVEMDELDISSIVPFDQTKIDISMKPLTLDLIINRLRNDEIDLMPDFQRKAGLWDSNKKSRLIESLILRIPLPAFYFDGSDDGKWLIIDGLQRLTAIKEFFLDDSLKLSGLEFLGDYEGCTIKDLPRTYSRRMMETQLVTYVINPGTPKDVKYNIFKRINTSGLELELQEIRHALFQGKATKVLKEWSEHGSFLQATDKSIKSERMLDREFVLRHLAFRQIGYENYEGKMDEYLNKMMDILNGYDDELIEQLKQNFIMAMELSFEIFGDRAFRKIFSGNNRKNRINVGLFDAWSVVLSMLSQNDVVKIKANKGLLYGMFIQEMEDNEPFATQYLNSATKHAIISRFEVINKMVNEVLGK